MLPRPKFLLFALLVLCVASCGLKGPLYNPDEQRSESVTPAAEPSATKKKQGEPSVQPPDPDRPAVPPGR